MNDETDIAETDIAKDPREEIARLEARIEQLADDLEHGRKIGVLSNFILAGGALWLIAGLLGMASMGLAMMGSVAAILGGLVLNGSNRSTTQQVRAALDAAEASRVDLIGAIELRTVDGRIEAGSPGHWLH